jgi:glycyl-tRNA synthetase beta chain
MSDNADFLVELGTEELPPKALRTLEEAFREGLLARIDAAPTCCSRAAPGNEGQ